MGRERLMAQQRARVLEMRARKLAEKKAAEAAKKAAETAKKITATRNAEELKPTFKASGANLQKPPSRLQAEFNASGAKLVKLGGSQKADPPKPSKNVKPSPKAQPSTSTQSAGTKPVNTKPVQKKSRVQKAAQAVRTPASNKAVKGGYTISPDKRQPGTRGASQQATKKSKPNSQQRRKAGLTKKGKGTSLKDVIKKFDSKLRLTYKKNELVQRGNEVFRSDGKGGFTFVGKKQF